VAVGGLVGIGFAARDESRAATRALWTTGGIFGGFTMLHALLPSDIENLAAKAPGMSEEVLRAAWGGVASAASRVR